MQSPWIKNPRIKNVQFAADISTMRDTLLAIILAAAVASVASAQDIAVMAVFEGKAVFQIDGSKRVLVAGERSPEGLKLIKTEGDAVVVELNGRRETLTVGSHAMGAISAPQTIDVTLAPDQLGMYPAAGSVNGQPVNFLVDTGATLVALNSQHARRLGIDYRVAGKKSQVETASGVETAYYIQLKTVKIGAIELRDVDTVVLDGTFPSTALLGMSFLGRVDLQRNGTALVLKKRY